MVVEAARRQQHALEMELSRVHQLLAENSKVEQVHKLLTVILTKCFSLLTHPHIHSLLSAHKFIKISSCYDYDDYEGKDGF